MKQLRQIQSWCGGTASAAGPRTFSGCMAGAGMQGKSMHPGPEASEAETDGGDVAENEKMEPPGIEGGMNHPSGK